MMPPLSSKKKSRPERVRLKVALKITDSKLAHGEVEMPRIGRSRPLMALLFGVVAMMLVVACGGGGESSSQNKAAPTSVPASSSNKLDTLPAKSDPGAKPRFRKPERSASQSSSR